MTNGSKNVILRATHLLTQREILPDVQWLDLRVAEQDESCGHSMSDVRRAPQDLEPADAGQVSEEDVEEEEGVSFGLNYALWL